MARDFSGFELEVLQSADLSHAHRRALLGLFRANYRQANPAHLEQSLCRLRYVATARQQGTLVGFALGETRLLDLPRLGGELVSLGGISCIAPSLRRHGLFGELSRLVVTTGDVPRRPRRLLCGRMAHPAGMRVVSRNPTVVPRPGVRPTAWQREVGQTIAQVYGVHAFDPETFVCIGGGEPIGYPNIELEAEPAEWEVFRPVRRERGDALLAIAWHPVAPPGW